MENFELVYDYRNEMMGPVWILLAVVFAAIMISLAIWRRDRFSPKGYVTLIVICISASVAVLLSVQAVSEGRGIKRMIEQGKFKVVEGYVENYYLKRGKSARESFNVGNVYFDYTEDKPFHGFSKVGWPIYKDGQFVRIGYYYPSENWSPFASNCIVLIAIRRSAQ